MVDACTWAASEHGCDVDVDVTEIFRGYRQPSSSAAVALARAALERCGIEPREVATGGGSDANALVARGFECVLLANGTEANHTPPRASPRRGSTEMLAVCEAIAELGGGTPADAEAAPRGRGHGRPARRSRSAASSAAPGPTRRWSATSRSATR